ncbi:MAG: LamG-like jellyroll fold domain-containing protein [Verrucomicrobiia bacterium]|jgi:hypothetical protein
MKLTPMRRFRLLFAMPALVVVGTGVRAGESVATHASAPVVWELASVASIGGHKPEVLGAPQVTDEAPGGRALRFGGWNDGIVLSVNPLAGRTTFTIEVLLMPEVNGAPAQRFLHIEDETGSRILMETRTRGGKSWSLDTYLHTDIGRANCPLLDSKKLHPAGRWAWVALTYDGRMMAHYVNAVKELEGEVVFTPMTSGQISLGVRLTRAFWFRGCIQEVRFHPTAIQPAAMQRLSE